MYAGIPLFSAQSYLEANPDVRGAVEAGQVGSPSQHFLNYGIFEGRLQPNTALPQREFSLLTAPAGSHWIVAAPKCVEPEVSIIIAAFNNPEKTLSCISSVIQNTVLERYEIVVVDDCSTDDEARALYRRTENVHWVHNEENFGYLVSCNLGARHAVGRYLLFLNNDTNVTKGCIDELLAVIKSSSSVGLVGPKLVYPDGRLQEAGGVIFASGRCWNFGRGATDPLASAYSYVKPVDYISGAAFIIRTDTWDAVQGYSTEFAPAYYEDTDLCLKVRKLGLEVICTPFAITIHEEGASYGNDDGGGVKRALLEANRHRFREKWAGALTAYNNDSNEIERALFGARDRSSEKKHILFIDHYVPKPQQDAGSKAAMSLLSGLAQYGQVHFLPANYHYDPRDYGVVELHRLGIEVLGGDRFTFEAWLDRYGDSIDCCFVSRPHIAEKFVPVVQESVHCKLIYVAHDLESFRLGREWEPSDGERVPALASRSELAKVIERENKLISAADAAVFFSGAEVAEVEQRLPGTKALSIPLYALPPPTERESDLATRRNVLFVGGFAHAPNLDGIEWFITAVWESVLSAVSDDVNLVIVGSNIPDSLVELASGLERVQLLPDASEAELARAYRCSRVAIAPLRFGAGVKGKVVEAMWHGVPVVTTSIGAEGIPLESEPIRIRNSAEAFARAVAELLCSDASALGLIEAGYQTINNEYSETKRNSVIEHLLLESVANS